MIYTCPLCRSKFEARAGGLYRCPTCDGEVRVGPVASPGTAWDLESRGRWFEAFFDVVKAAATDPIRFFERVAAGRGWLRPWALALIISALVFMVSAAYQMGFQALAAGSELGGIADPVESLAFLTVFPISAGVLAALGVIGVPIGTTVALIVQAGIFHLCLMLLGAAKREFVATFRVSCYCMIPQLAQFVPIMGGPIAWMWQTALAIIGLKVVHRTSYGRSAVAVFLPMLLCCGGIMLIGIAAAGWIFAAMMAKAV